MTHYIDMYRRYHRITCRNYLINVIAGFIILCTFCVELRHVNGGVGGGSDGDGVRLTNRVYHASYRKKKINDDGMSLVNANKLHIMCATVIYISIDVVSSISGIRQTGKFAHSKKKTKYD